MTKKMTRREALTNVLVFLNEDEVYGRDNWIEEIAILEKMIEQIDKQAARPKGKSNARMENERMAREFIEVLRDYGKPVSAKWMTEHVRYCLSPQKAVQVAKIAEEWGAIERVTIKKRTYYEYVDSYRPLV